MSKILLVIGSARKGRVADKVLEYVQSELAERNDAEASVVDLAKLSLPFFDSEIIPADPNFSPTINQAAAKWSELVTSHDKVLFITPEYNHSMSAIEKNAIDWLYKEWENKHVSATAYGWNGGGDALKTFDTVMNNVKAVVNAPAQLYFTKTINPDGSQVDAEAVSAAINAQLDDLLQ